MLNRLASYAKHLLMPLRLRWAVRRVKSLTIVEVGANDGRTGDPLSRLIKRSKTGRAILIEPVPYLYDRMRQEYANCPWCVPVNVAITKDRGESPIYYISPDALGKVQSLPTYFEELASLDRERVAACLGKDGERFLQVHTVPTLPLADLLEQYGVDDVDVLQIDTEGHDFEVLKTFPFNLIKPKVVCYEHSHLTAGIREESQRLMRGYGYKIEPWGKDYVCILQH